MFLDYVLYKHYYYVFCIIINYLRIHQYTSFPTIKKISIKNIFYSFNDFFIKRLAKTLTRAKSFR